MDSGSGAGMTVEKGGTMLGNHIGGWGWIHALGARPGASSTLAARSGSGMTGMEGARVGSRGVPFRPAATGRCGAWRLMGLL